MMTKSAMTATSAGLLTQTSLQLDGVTTEPAAERIAKVLRRVPGVLLAEVDATSGRVTVAHDEAVEMKSLLAGVQSAGWHATSVVARPSRAADVGATPHENALRRRCVMTLASGLFVVIVLVGSVVPNVAYKQWLLQSLMLFSLGLVYLCVAGPQQRRPRS